MFALIGNWNLAFQRWRNGRDVVPFQSSWLPHFAKIVLFWVRALLDSHRTKNVAEAASLLGYSE
jgi:hypothetical protein